MIGALEREEDRRRRTWPVLARLLLAVMILSSAGSLFSGTVATLNSVTVNPGATFVAGQLILSNTVAGRNPCLSTGEAVKCDALFTDKLAPGHPDTTVVTLRNEGTVPARKLVLWSGACSGGDLCRMTMLTVHDDEHDYCYYPKQVSGGCQLDPSATLADFAARYPQSSALQLSPDHLGTGIAYSLTVEVPANAGNEFQNRGGEVNFTWFVTS